MLNTCRNSLKGVNMLKNKIKKGFTLSEVLLTLCILGTLMAITLPVLMNGTNRNAYVNGLKKAYGLLDTASNTIMTNNSGTLVGAFSSIDNLVNKYCSILECNKICTYGQAVDDGCFNAQSDMKNLSGNSIWIDPTDGAISGFVLADGTTVLAQRTDELGTCTAIDDGLSDICGYIIVDINGFNHPNTVGRDIFTFDITARGIIPVSFDNPDYNAFCDPSSAEGLSGNQCATRIIREGAMNY